MFRERRKRPTFLICKHCGQGAEIELEPTTADEYNYSAPMHIIPEVLNKLNREFGYGEKRKIKQSKRT